jgi:hypothetical protein
MDSYKIINVDLTNNIVYYQKWRHYFEEYLTHLYHKMVSDLDNSQILYREYDYDFFCKFMFNNSSKRIPKY